MKNGIQYVDTGNQGRIINTKKHKWIRKNMADWCENTLVVEADTPKGAIQLKDFVTKSKSAEEEFSIEANYPIPGELKEATNKMMDYGLAIILYRNGDESMLNKYLESEWVKDKKINSLQELEEYLIDNCWANLDEGINIFKCLKNYGVITQDAWRYKYWGTRWSTQSKVIQNRDNCYVVFFFTKNSPPDAWLSNISKEYPDLKFDLEWIIFGSGDGIINANNGELIESDRITEDW